MTIPLLCICPSNHFGVQTFVLEFEWIQCFFFVCLFLQQAQIGYPKLPLDHFILKTIIIIESILRYMSNVKCYGAIQ